MAEGAPDLFEAAAEETSVPELHILYLDTETTGPDPEKAEVCELAMLLTPYSGSARSEGSSQLCRLVRPTGPVPPEASAVHHITNAMLEDAPSVKDLEQDARELVSRADLVAAHNLPYDLSILKRQMPSVFEAVAEEAELDTLRLSRHVWPFIPSHSLQTLRYRFGLDEGLTGDAHRALFDTFLVRALLEKIMTEGLTDASTWGELADISRSPLEIQTFGFGKYRGQLVEDIIASDPDYIRWLLRQKWIPNDYPDLYHTILKKSGRSGGDR